MFYNKRSYSVFSRTRNNKTKYYIRFEYDGKTVDRILKGCSSQKDADRIAADAYINEMQNLLKGETASKASRDSSVLMESAINRVFLNDDAVYFEFNKVGIEQQSIYRGRCRNYILPFFKDIKITCVSLETIRKFRAYMKGLDLSNKTMHEVERLVRVVMKWIPDLFPRIRNFRNPYMSPMVKTIHFDKEGNATPAFEVDEVRALFASEWESYPCLCMSLIAAFTGMRSNEVACLRKSKFFSADEHCIITVDQNWTFSERKLKDPKTKNGTRKVLIPKWLYDFILPVLDSVPDGCFPFHNSKSLEIPMKGDRYNRALEKAVGKAGFLPKYKEKGLRFYSFRSFFKSYVELTLGHESALIRYVMGHSKRDIDDHYFKFLDAHIPLLLSATKNLLPDYEALFRQKCYLVFKERTECQKEGSSDLLK